MTPRPFLVPPCAAFLLAALLAAPAFAQRAAAAPKIPQSTALLGIAAPRVPAGGGGTFFSSSSLQGDGSVANPYIKVQIPGFDKSEAAATSPWKSRRFAPPALGPCAQEPVQVVTTDRRHARLSPLYRDPATGFCSQSLNCNPGLALEIVELHQGLIDAGTCSYGSIAFDVRIVPNGDDAIVCAGRTYMTAAVIEHDPQSGISIFGHEFVVDRAMFTSLGLGNWKRLTFHFPMQVPGSLLSVAFRLNAASCSSSPGPGGPFAYPATVDVDNVALDTIPVVNFGVGGAITSGCASGVPGCGFGFLPLYQQALFGVPCTFAQHDSFAPVLCPQSYCQADLDFDGFVDSRDLAILLTDWGTLPTNICQRRFADLDGDQQVGSSDLGVLLSGWGPCP